VNGDSCIVQPITGDDIEVTSGLEAGDVYYDGGRGERW
jgi:hypothetical protein